MLELAWNSFVKAYINDPLPPVGSLDSQTWCLRDMVYEISRHLSLLFVLKPHLYYKEEVGETKLKKVVAPHRL